MVRKIMGMVILLMLGASLLLSYSQQAPKSEISPQDENPSQASATENPSTADSDHKNAGDAHADEQDGAGPHTKPHTSPDHEHPSDHICPRTRIDPEKAIALSIKDCIRLAIEKNLDIATKGLRFHTSLEEITAKESRFDPVISFGFSQQYSRTPSTSTLDGALNPQSEYISGNLSIDQRLLTGGSLSLELKQSRRWRNSTYSSLNPYYKHDADLILSHPLLKGLWTNQYRLDIIIAKNESEISLEEFKERVAKIVTDTQNLYWDYFFALNDLAVKRISLRQAQELLKINQALVEAGRRTEEEILQARASVAIREKEVLIAADAIRDVEDELKIITNIVEDKTYWDKRIVITDKPDFTILEPDLTKTLATALSNRYDLQMARVDLKNRNIKLALAKNNLLPTLDLKATFGLNGLGSKYHDSYDTMGTNRYRDWYIGFDVKYPWGNREARAQYNQEKDYNEEAILNYKKLELNAIKEVREAVRNVYTNIKKVNATKTVVALELKKLESEFERYKAGLSTSYQVLEFQEDLAEARIDYFRALAQ